MTISLVEPPQDYGEALPVGARSPAMYAASAILSRGRRHAEPECPTRSPFQRDRDRILHASAFRRLTYKTQVFVYHEGDHFRTRLTHSLEVAQIARTVARQLRLDEDLAEALALAHDLGHSPFGHAGERALDALMAAFGGFDHNAQSLRVVTRLERKYPAFDGLNLTWETQEGLAKHNGPLQDGSPVRKVATRLAQGWRDLELASWPSAEAQVAALADDIAYLTHDIDDGMRAGLLTLAEIEAAPLAGPEALKVSEGRASTVDTRLIYGITRNMVTIMIADLVGETRARLAALAPTTPEHIRAAGRPLVGFSPGMQRDMDALRRFLFERVYRHRRVARVMTDAAAIVRDLFQRYMSDPAAMPEPWRVARSGRGARQEARIVADFVAGQTDRYALSEHRRLFDATPDLR